MKKHAYLILAHNHFDLLERLMGLLDDERNDIFLHIDKKVTGFDFGYFTRVCSRARVFSVANRQDSAWGSQELVLAELELFRTANAQGPYHCYHLLSGACLPLKSQNEIHRIFEDFSVSALGYTDQPAQWDIKRLTRYHRLFPQKGLGVWLNKAVADLQEKIGFDRLRHTDIQVCKGSQWGSLTQEAVNCLLEQEELIRKLTRHSLCADEIYKQTILYRWGVPMSKDSRRLILWDKDWHPRVLTMANWPAIEETDALFARKFDPTVDGAVIEKLIEKVGNKDNG